MIVFHFIVDINFFGAGRVDVYSSFWLLFARITAGMFIFLVGVSMTLSYSRAAKNSKNLFLKYFRRGVYILALGLVLTLASWIFIPSCYIIFGVLHFIGVSIILSFFFIRFRYLNLILGVVIIIAGSYFLAVSSQYLLWLAPYCFCSLDYFPLFPWFGLVLLGIFFGKLVYPNGKGRIRHVNHPFVGFFTMLGRRSLVIYLLHQPILIAILYAFML